VSDQAAQGQSDVPHVDDTAQAAPTSSILGQLTARRAALVAERPPLDLEIPGYGGDLVARYQFVPFERMGRIGLDLEKVKDKTAQVRFAAADTLIACCREIMVQVDGEVVPLADEAGLHHPVQFDEALSEILALDVSRARDVVFAVFGNDYAVIEQAGTVSDWLRDGSPEVDRDLLGEA
jgi:hypothetical protein